MAPRSYASRCSADETQPESLRLLLSGKSREEIRPWRALVNRWSSPAFMGNFGIRIPTKEEKIFSLVLDWSSMATLLVTSRRNSAIINPNLNRVFKKKSYILFLPGFLPGYFAPAGTFKVSIRSWFSTRAKTWIGKFCFIYNLRHFS